MWGGVQLSSRNKKTQKSDFAPKACFSRFTATPVGFSCILNYFLVVSFVFNVIIKTCPMLSPLYGVSSGLFCWVLLTEANGAGEKTAREVRVQPVYLSAGRVLCHVLALGAVLMSRGRQDAAGWGIRSCTRFPRRVFPSFPLIQLASRMTMFCCSQGLCKRVFQQ